jgi:hypothetical protein
MNIMYIVNYLQLSLPQSLMLRANQALLMRLQALVVYNASHHLVLPPDEVKVACEESHWLMMKSPHKRMCSVASVSS